MFVRFSQRRLCPGHQPMASDCICDLACAWRMLARYSRLMARAVKACQRSRPYMRLETVDLMLLSVFASGGGQTDDLHRPLYLGCQFDRLRRCYLLVEFVGRPEDALLPAGACMQPFCRACYCLRRASCYPAGVLSAGGNLSVLRLR